MKYYGAPGAWSFAENLAIHIPGVYDSIWADRDGLIYSMSANLSERELLREYFSKKEVIKTTTEADHFCRYLSLMCDVSQPLSRRRKSHDIPQPRVQLSNTPAPGSLRYHKGRFSSQRYNCESNPPSPIGSGRPSPHSSASTSPSPTFASLRTPGRTPPPISRPAPQQREEGAYYTTVYEGPPMLRKLENAHLLSESEIRALPEYARAFAMQRRQARLPSCTPAVAQPQAFAEQRRPPLSMERKSLLLSVLMGREEGGEAGETWKERSRCDDLEVQGVLVA